MFPITSARIVYRASLKFSEDGGTRLGAALAYYALFSIAPLLLIAVHTTGAVFGKGWLGLLWDYALAVIMVFITAALLLVSLACSLALPILQRMMHENLVQLEPSWHWIEIGISFVFLTVLFATSYRILSGGRMP